MTHPMVRICFFLLALVASARAQEKSPKNFCTAEVLGTFEIEAALDGRTLRLRDGREALLAGLEIPSSPDSGAAGMGSVARAALHGLVAGNSVVLWKAGPEDRYGRMAVQAFLPPNDDRWIQQEMLARGLAQVGARPGGAACARALWKAEAPARQNKLGLWADSHYAVRTSDDPSLASAKGRFMVLEGKVVSVREAGGAVYLNFGRVWSRNLTVTILRRNIRAFSAAGLDPKKLEGTRLRVRGWIEDRGGPRIEATRPEQIEIAAQD